MATAPQTPLQITDQATALSQGTLTGFYIPGASMASISGPIMAFMRQAHSALPFAPPAMAMAAQMMLSVDRLPVMVTEPETAWWAIRSNAQRAAWKEVVQRYRNVVAPIYKKELAVAKAAVEKANADANFWATVRRTTVAVATMGLSELVPAVQAKWEELQTKLAEYKSTRESAVREMQNPATTAARRAQLADALSKTDSWVLRSLAGSKPEEDLKPALAKDAGLGVIAPLALFGSLGAAAQLVILGAAIAGVIGAIKVLNDLGVFAVVGAVGDTLKAVRGVAGPLMGAVVLAGIGWYLYRRYVKA